ncbi:MAG TPA: hypothetical protein VN704_00885 [Verrucomicrobiae bacterium]|nr:hypothetical protein [Verrucomicrobiae bacterium]
MSESIYSDLSSIKCPKCNGNSNIDVLGKHVFPGSNIPSLYDFVCLKCDEIFTPRVSSTILKKNET